jgi:hypothetical protein
LADPTDKDKQPPEESGERSDGTGPWNAQSGDGSGGGPSDGRPEDMPDMEIPKDGESDGNADADATSESEKRADDVTKQPAAPRKRSRAPWVILVLILIAGAAGGAYWYAMQQRGTGGAELAGIETRLQSVQSDIAALRDVGGRVDALRTRVAGIEKQLEGAPDVSGQIAPLEERVTALEGRIDSARAELTAAIQDSAGRLNERIAALEAVRDQLSGNVEDAEKRAQEIAAREEARAQRLDALREENSSLKSAVEALTQRLAAVEQAASQARAPMAGRENAFALAVGQLRGVLATGDPFARDLAAVAAVASDDAEVQAALDAIRPFAETGVPTRAALVTRFTPVADKVVSAGNLPESESWWDTTVNRLSRVVNFRKVGEPETGDTARAIASRAEALLAKGDVAGAVTEVEGLTGDAADAATAWLADARARVAADRAAATLARRAVAVLSGNASATGGN